MTDPKLDMQRYADARYTGSLRIEVATNGGGVRRVKVYEVTHTEVAP